MTSSLDQERLQHALNLAYAFIDRRDRTVSEVRSQLERRGIHEPLREQVVGALVEQGFLDDRRFARLFVSDKRELEQWGRERIRRGLVARGIERGLADDVMTQAETDGGGEAGEETELERALSFLRRRFPHPPHDRREREQALGVLLRKGYEIELALDALAAHARGD